MSIKVPASVDVAQYMFYLGMCLIAGTAEYLHLAPPGTLVGILGIVTGHFFGNGATKSVLGSIAGNVSTITSSVVTNQRDIASNKAGITALESQHRNDTSS